MIDKKQAEAKGVRIIDSNETLANSTAATIAQLKSLLPKVINSDNQLDARALADVLDIANTTSNNQGYELTFAGKGIARAKADSPTNLELKTELIQSKNFDETDNVVIRGDNIDVLKILYQNYHNKIKMIYIDPPYNTQSENFVYNDNFKQNEEELIEHFGMNEDTSDFLHNVYGTRSHSGWLSFMYPRLKLARDLLTDDGVIFISIDDNEQANLKIICDEIFGEDNFVGSFCIKSTPNARDYGHIGKMHEYCLFYVKNTNIAKTFHLSYAQKFKYEDNIGGFNIHPLYNSNEAFHKENRPNLYYPFYLYLNEDKDENGFYRIGLDKKENSVEIYPPSDENSIPSVWRWGIEKAKENINKEIIGHCTRENNYRIVQKMRKSAKVIRSILDTKSVSNRHGTSEVEALFGGKIFLFPKPISLLNSLLQCSTENNDIILDFFAGSGTTGDAVMQINAEDGGNRKFVLVQWDEIIDKKKSAEAHKFCTDNNFEPVISSITIERLNRAGKKIKEEHIAKNGDLLLTPPPPPPPPPILAIRCLA